jgi:hypothetical protein
VKTYFWAVGVTKKVPAKPVTFLRERRMMQTPDCFAVTPFYKGGFFIRPKVKTYTRGFGKKWTFLPVENTKKSRGDPDDFLRRGRRPRRPA